MELLVYVIGGCFNGSKAATVFPKVYLSSIRFPSPVHLSPSDSLASLELGILRDTKFQVLFVLLTWNLPLSLRLASDSWAFSPPVSASRVVRMRDLLPGPGFASFFFFSPKRRSNRCLCNRSNISCRFFVIVVLSCLFEKEPCLIGQGALECVILSLWNARIIL